jgi:hypothetical protein
MFHDEVAVTYPCTWDNEWQASVFVPLSFVRHENDHRGEVMVDVIVLGKTRFAVLPSQERDIVRPDEADLTLQ